MLKADINLIGDEIKNDPSLTERREAPEDRDVFVRQFQARQTQILPSVRSVEQSSTTGEHPPIRSTSTDADKMLILPERVECPPQDASGEAEVPYYGQDDEESIVGTGV